MIQRFRPKKLSYRKGLSILRGKMVRWKEVTEKTIKFYTIARYLLAKGVNGTGKEARKKT